MCGIAGIWNFNNKVDLDNLESFTDSMEHRGPDGSGYELLNNDFLGLGHRRLSILDLSENGKQPMVFENYTIVYNGEIFNFQEIKDDLILKGYSFKTETDTEVLLASYKEWGELAFHKWNGMWAFALYDSITEELLICSDRFGIKPCYYSYEEGKRFSFASETYAFGSLAGFKKEFDWGKVDIEIKDDSILECLGYTIFKNIYRLLPGHFLRLKKGETPKQKRWYDIRKQVEKPSLSFGEACSRFKELFEDSCRLRLRSDVPIATALSGGLDSSVVYGVLQKIGKSKKTLIRTPIDMHSAYTMTFPEWENDESEFAKEVLKFHRRAGNFVEVTEGTIVNKMKDITLQSDLLVGNSVLSVFELYNKMKKDGITVSIDGHGVDEMLYGYKSMIWEYFEQQLAINNIEVATKIGEYLVKTFPKSKRKENEDYIKSRINQSLIKKIYTSLKVSKKDQTKKLKSLSNFPYAWDMKDPESIAKKYFFNGQLLPVLRNFDKISMMAGIEVRMPFMDYRLVEFSFSLPFHYKLNEEFNKLIVREAFQDVLPPRIKNRVLKLGFISPIEVWIEKYFMGEIKQIKNTNFYKELPYRTKALLKNNNWKLMNLYFLNESQN